MNTALARNCRPGQRYVYALLVALAAVSSGQGQDSEADEFRTWTDNTGRHSIQAQLVEVDGEHVVLRKQNGLIVRVPLDRLSDADRRVALGARESAAAGGSQEDRPGPPAGLATAALVSREAPTGIIVFSDLEMQEPVFATLFVRGSAVADISEYGFVTLEEAVDDKGASLSLLKPIESTPFGEGLEQQFVALDPFFLDRPDTIAMHLILQTPSAGASALSLAGSLQVKLRETITVENVLQHLGEQLTAPRLAAVGRFRVEEPNPDDVDDPETALAIDFVGDPDRIQDIELLRGDGSKLSTGGFSFASARGSRMVRWGGEKLPQDTKLRIVLAGEPRVETISFRITDIPIRDEAGDVTDLTEPGPGTELEDPSGAWRIPGGIAPFDQQQARRLQQDWANELSTSVELTNSVGMSMLLIPPGRFTMGSSEQDVERFATNERSWWAPHIRTEAPQRVVTIARPLYVGACEVTVGQFRQFVDASGHVTEAERSGRGGIGHRQGKEMQHPEFTWRNIGLPQSDEHPVSNVSFRDALAFCNWLSQAEGADYRLPTEAEWEYACRAGTTTLWHFGDDAKDADEYAWHRDNSGGRPHPVGQLKPNAFGLFDMHGNLFEMCLDFFDNQTGRPVAPLASPDEHLVSVRHCARAGAFLREDPLVMRSASRFPLPEAGPTFIFGFRVVREVDQE